MSRGSIAVGLLLASMSWVSQSPAQERGCGNSPDPCTPVRDFDDVKGWIMEQGFDLRGAYVKREHVSAWELGGAAVIGFHHVSHFVATDNERGFARMMTIQPALVLTALLGPSDAILGNEQGLDLRVQVHRVLPDEGDPGTAYELLLDPKFAVSFARWRTNALVGSFLPYVGVEKRPDAALALSFGWSLYPFAYLLTDHLILDVNPFTAGIRAPFDGEHVSAQLVAQVGLHLATKISR